MKNLATLLCSSVLGLSTGTAQAQSPIDEASTTMAAAEPTTLDLQGERETAPAPASSATEVVAAPDAAVAQDAAPEAEAPSSDATVGDEAPTDAAAQSADGGGIQEITVTANKREERLNRVGLTITALSADSLAERKISTLEDLASAIPGLAFSPSTTNTPIFTLRGVGFNESSLGVYPAVSVYLDQAPLPFPVLASHTAFDLQRVEVLKGPQGTLFGQNSTGGAINYIAARPTKTLASGGDISYGTFNTIEGNAFVSGPLSDSLGFRLAATGVNSDDWQRSVTTDDTNGHQSYKAGRFLLDWDPGEKLQLAFNVNGWVDKSQPQAQQLIAMNPQAPGFATPGQLNPVFVPNNARDADWTGTVLDPGTGVIEAPTAFGGESDPGGPVPGTAKLASFEPFADRKFYQTAARADYELAGFTLTSLTSYNHYDQTQRTDGDGSALVTFDLQKNDGYIHNFNQELRVANDPESSLRWILGTNYEKSTTFEDQLLRYFDNSNFNPSVNWINASGVTNKQKIDNYAFFGNAEYDLGEEFTIKAALRYTNSKNDSSICSYTTPTGRVDTLFGGAGLDGTCFTYTETFTNVAPITGKLKEDNVSWRAGLDYKLDSAKLLYANISRGYKAGSFPSLSAASYLSLLPVTQESVTAYETGVKAKVFDGLAQVNAAAFYYDYKDKQVRGKLRDETFGGLDTLVNVPKSRIAGAETDVSVFPLDGLTINLAVTYLDSKITKGPQSPKNFNIYGLPDHFEGDPLPFTPEWSGALNVDYRTHLWGGAPFLGFTLNTRSKSDAVIGAHRIDFPASETSTVRPGVDDVFGVDGYTTVDARLGYEAEDGAWKVMLWGKNIFDEYYWTTVIPSNDSAARFAGRPATFGITTAFKFGG